MKVEVALKGVTRLYLDTAPVIYLVEQNSQFFDQVRAVFQKVDEGQFRVVTSPITLAECLVGAYRMNQPELATNFIQCLTQQPTDFVQISAEIGEQAARLRVKYNLQLPDALQIATAIASNCQGFLTNDAQLQRVTEVRVLLVSELQI